MGSIDDDTLDLSVNVSGRQLDSGAVVDHIRAALEASGLEAGSLIVEVQRRGSLWLDGHGGQLHVWRDHSRLHG